MTFLDFYKPIRRYSYPLTAVLVVLALAYFFVYKKVSLLGAVLVPAAAAACWFLWLKLRPGTSEITRAEQVLAAIGNGRPTFLNVYSNY